MKIINIVAFGLMAAAHGLASAQGSYDGLANGIGNLYRLSNAKSYSIGPENLTGEK